MKEELMELVNYDFLGKYSAQYYKIIFPTKLFDRIVDIGT